MKPTIALVCSLLFASCGEIGINTPDPQPQATFDVSLECENRIYDLGETVNITLDVAQKNAQDDRFLLTSTCSGGDATATIDGANFQWGQEQVIYYTVSNETSSTRTVHLSVTPAASTVTNQSLHIELLISSLNAAEVVKKDLTLRIANLAPIYVQAKYKNDPIEMKDRLSIALSAEKEQYTGDFVVTPRITRGDGTFIVGENIYVSGQNFTIPGDVFSLIYYQPAALGVHNFTLKVSESTFSTDVNVQIEVFNQGGITEPREGVYIFANGLYFKQEQWDKTLGYTPEGIAVFTDACSFIIAPKLFKGQWCKGTPTTTPDYPSCATVEDAIKDFDGKAHTAALLNLLTAHPNIEFPLAEYCYYYDPEHPGEWYLPAPGQLHIIHQHLTEINKYMDLIQGTRFYSCVAFKSYPSSVTNAHEVWALFPDLKTLSTSGTHSAECACKPICNIPSKL